MTMCLIGQRLVCNSGRDSFNVSMGDNTYYENIGKENTLKAVAYLQEIGFQELADVMKKGLIDDNLEEITRWVDQHDELIYTVYLKIIQQSKYYIIR